MTTLDIFSDPICPWCLIGKTLLDRAIAAHPAPVFDVRWHPFQLNPEMPAEGMDRTRYLEDKFGGPDGAARVYGGIAQRAADEGIEVDFAAIARTPNTLDAHRVIHWAGIEGHQAPVVDALFGAYFRDGRDIGDHAVLADIADSAGMDAALVHRLLASDADRDDIRARDGAARDMGVTAVPTFVVAGKHAVPGATPTDLWLKVMAEVSGVSEPATGA